MGAAGEGSPGTPALGPLPASATEKETLVGLVHLLQEDEGEDGVGAQAGVVGRETLPQAEEALVADNLHQHVLNGKAGRVKAWLLGLRPSSPPPSPPSSLSPAQLPHQPVLVFRLPVNHSHVLDPGEEEAGA